MRGTTRYVEQRSIPSSSALQDGRAQEHLPYTNHAFSGLLAGIANSGSPSISSSYSSTTSSVNTCGSAPTPRTSPHNGSSITPLKAFDTDCLLTPSTLVQTTPESITCCDTDEIDWYETGRKCPFDKYIPPVVEATSRNPVGASVWSAEARQDHTITSAQPSEQPMYHHEQASHANHYHSQSQESTSTSPFSGMHDPVTPSDFSTDIQPDVNNMQYTSNYSETNNLQSHSNYGSAPNSTGTADSFMHDQNSIPSMADLNALYEKVDTASADAWRSFMQQFDLTNVDVPGFNWEEMTFN